MNKHNDGVENELNLMNYINSKNSFDFYNENIKNFLRFIFDFDLENKTIRCNKIKGNAKPDLEITCNGVSKYISIKKGSGNSVHQESLNDFITFLKNINIPEQTINNILLFHYGDGTNNDTGTKRYASPEVKKIFKDEIKIANKSLNDSTNLKIIIKRILFLGRTHDLETDFIYHGTVDEGLWASKREIVEYFINNNFNSQSIHFASLNYQPWGRNNDFKAKNPNRRYIIQIKWSKMKSDLLKIRINNDFNSSKKIFSEGKNQEIKFVRNFNSNKTKYINYIRKLGVDIENSWLVRVAGQQFSTLSEKNVYTRADAFLIKSDDKKINDILKINNHYLDEKILIEEKIIFSLVSYSGISIKLNTSEKFQILKLTPKSFKKLFNSYELGAGASLYCLRDEETVKNANLISGWNTSSESMNKYFNFLVKEKVIFEKDRSACETIKKYSTSRIKELIDGSVELQRKIFNGEKIYSEPYAAWFFSKGSEIKELDYIPFTVTTGSGRSKNNYTIVLKPKQNKW
ncbi:hypothetical protein ACA758_02315 [Mycoplasmopsis agassizii]|uniref:hypothetical protein n=1 Tax=Mycoplasmopsis agassizii TaxID=33922 RepID=UPI0035289175